MMNHAASIDHTFRPQRPDGRGPALGWGVSLAVHALALAWVWQAWPPRPADTDAGRGMRLEVRLLSVARQAPPAQPPTETAPRPASPPAPTPARSNARAITERPRADHAQTPPSVRSGATPSAALPIPDAPPIPAASAAPAEAPAADASGPATDAPAVDIGSARAAARLIARENAKGLVALPERKPVVDPNENHHVIDPIERARRIDCQTARAESTNLLANVVMLAVDLTKNAIDDSGCKWR
jgi:hypothetical protein